MALQHLILQVEEASLLVKVLQEKIEAEDYNLSFGFHFLPVGYQAGYLAKTRNEVNVYKRVLAALLSDGARRESEGYGQDWTPVEFFLDPVGSE